LQLRDGRIDPTLLQLTFQRMQDRAFTAKIYGLVKTRTSLDVYITDARGIVIFDSTGKSVGEDFSRWNDVARTLRGDYGARSSRSDADDPASGALFVSAPIRHGDAVIGVLTVVKSKDSVTPFIDLARRKFILAGWMAAGGIILFSILITIWITSPIKRLRTYVESLQSDHPLPVPRSSGEVGELARAFEAMRRELEGRQYVERYVQTLTHEIKSPLAAIRGSAEILQSDLTEEDRKRMLRHIETESGRINEIIQRMLDLSSLENRSQLRDIEEIAVADLLADIAVSLEPIARQRQIKLDIKADQMIVRGERFLIRKAVENLIHNAIDFAPTSSTVRIACERRRGTIALLISDDGPGIPDYAIDRIFERFYSLPRPETGRKSTGLGLPFVKEVMELHGGRCEVTTNGQTTATLLFPD
jgi:two-component system sensor histidine kinase CreC